MTKKKFNNAYFFDTLILMYLYKKGTVSTDEMEKMFGAKFEDEQNVNNVVSNKKNSTSFIAKGFMEYDSDAHTLSITQKGKRRVRNWFSKRRK